MAVSNEQVNSSECPISVRELQAKKDNLKGKLIADGLLAADDGPRQSGVRATLTSSNVQSSVVSVNAGGLPSSGKVIYLSEIGQSNDSGVRTERAGGLTSFSRKIVSSSAFDSAPKTKTININDLVSVNAPASNVQTSIKSSVVSTRTQESSISKTINISSLQNLNPKEKKVLNMFKKLIKEKIIISKDGEVKKEDNEATIMLKEMESEEEAAPEESAEATAEIHEDEESEIQLRGEIENEVVAHVQLIEEEKEEQVEEFEEKEDEKEIINEMFDDYMQNYETNQTVEETMIINEYKEHVLNNYLDETMNRADVSGSFFVEKNRSFEASKGNVISEDLKKKLEEFPTYLKDAEEKGILEELKKKKKEETEVEMDTGLLQVAKPSEKARRRSIHEDEHVDERFTLTIHKKEAVQVNEVEEAEQVEELQETEQVEQVEEVMEVEQVMEPEQAEEVQEMEEMEEEETMTMGQVKTTHVEAVAPREAEYQSEDEQVEIVELVPQKDEEDDDDVLENFQDIVQEAREVGHFDDLAQKAKEIRQEAIKEVRPELEESKEEVVGFGNMGLSQPENKTGVMTDIRDQLLIDANLKHEEIKEVENSDIEFSDAFESEREDVVQRNVQPVVQQRTPVVQQRTPVIQQRAPIAQHRAPIVQQRAPVVQQRTPIVQQRAPATQQRTPVVQPRAQVNANVNLDSFSLRRYGNVQDFNLSQSRLKDSNFNLESGSTTRVTQKETTRTAAPIQKPTVTHRRTSSRVRLPHPDQIDSRKSLEKNKFRSSSRIRLEAETQAKQVTRTSIGRDSQGPMKTSQLMGNDSQIRTSGNVEHRRMSSRIRLADEQIKRSESVNVSMGGNLHSRGGTENARQIYERFEEVKAEPSIKGNGLGIQNRQPRKINMKEWGVSRQSGTVEVKASYRSPTQGKSGAGQRLMNGAPQTKIGTLTSLIQSNINRTEKKTNQYKTLPMTNELKAKISSAHTPLSKPRKKKINLSHYKSKKLTTSTSNELQLVSNRDTLTRSQLTGNYSSVSGGRVNVSSGAGAKKDWIADISSLQTSVVMNSQSKNVRRIKI